MTHTSVTPAVTRGSWMQGQSGPQRNREKEQYCNVYSEIHFWIKVLGTGHRADTVMSRTVTFLHHHSWVCVFVCFMKTGSHSVVQAVQTYFNMKPKWDLSLQQSFCFCLPNTGIYAWANMSSLLTHPISSSKRFLYFIV